MTVKLSGIVDAEFEISSHDQFLLYMLLFNRDKALRFCLMLINFGLVMVIK